MKPATQLPAALRHVLRILAQFSSLSCLPAAVVITFFVCWAPFHAQRLLYLYGQKIESFKSLNQWVFAVSGWLYYVSWWVVVTFTSQLNFKFLHTQWRSQRRPARINICCCKWIMLIWLRMCISCRSLSLYYCVLSRTHFRNAECRKYHPECGIFRQHVFQRNYSFRGKVESVSRNWLRALCCRQLLGWHVLCQFN